jgi:hypothetical protein
MSYGGYLGVEYSREHGFDPSGGPGGGPGGKGKKGKKNKRKRDGFNSMDDPAFDR